jgi:hypothetical protein
MKPTDNFSQFSENGMSTQDNNDGGPAFPHFKFAENGKVEILPQGGMTLRDYFAGQALVGMFADRFRSLNHEPYVVAHDAFVFADAMLVARKEATQ